MKNKPRYSQSTIRNARYLRKQMTSAETRLWFLIRQNFKGHHFRKQSVFGSYILDFCCIRSMLVIEVDGAWHRLKEAREYDFQRDRYLTDHGFTVIRFSNEKVLSKPQSCIAKIMKHLSSIDSQEKKLICNS